MTKQRWHLNTGDVAQMIEDCETRSVRLNDWETEFIDSVSDKESISDLQLERLEGIWNKVTEDG